MSLVLLIVGLTGAAILVVLAVTVVDWLETRRTAREIRVERDRRDYAMLEREFDHSDRGTDTHGEREDEHE